MKFPCSMDVGSYSTSNRGGMKAGIYLGVGLVLARGISSWPSWIHVPSSSSPRETQHDPSYRIDSTSGGGTPYHPPSIQPLLRSLTGQEQQQQQGHLQKSWIQLGPYIPNDSPHDETGFAVDLNHDGSRIIIGSPKNDGNGYSSGHARVFDYDPSIQNWTQVGEELVGPSLYGMAGLSVGINGNGKRIIVGMPFAEGVGQAGAQGGGFHSGQAQVYHQDTNSSSWLPLGNAIVGTAKYDYMGFAVDIDDLGDRIVVGAHGTDTVNGTDAGMARVYEYYKGSWVQLGQSLSGDASRDAFGESVALSDDGKRVIIGSSNSDGNGLMSGQVQVWEYEHLFDRWVLIGKKLHGEASGDLFGASVDISSNGKRIVVGARWNDGRGHYSGHARVFEEEDYQWVQVGEDINGEAAGDWSGRSVSLNHNGTLIAIGAPFNQGNGTQSGHVRVYAEADEDPGIWIQKANDMDGEAPGDRFGSSVRMSSLGTRVIGGAVYHGPESGGHARVFELKLNKNVKPNIPTNPGMPKWATAVIIVLSLVIGFLLAGFLFLFLKHK